MERILSALKFSAEKHRNQRRKDAEASPYINHPIQVAELLWNVGEVRDIIVILGALLHDTIEDTETTPDEIKKLFGDEVLGLVLEVTDDKRLSKKERKRLQIERAPLKSMRAKQLKICDKICNVRDVTNSPPKDWPFERRWEYLDWTEEVINGIRGTNKELESLYDEALAEGRKKLKQGKNKPIL
ncbi:HD domain-containing protein [bacterium]|nr:HD domain-containing protein [bacterium]